MAKIYGSAVGSDGSKIDGTAIVGTSWDNNTTQPHDGQYRLELRDNPKETITLYVNGEVYKDVYINGYVRTRMNEEVLNCIHTIYKYMKNAYN